MSPESQWRINCRMPSDPKNARSCLHHSKENFHLACSSSLSTLWSDGECKLKAYWSRPSVCTKRAHGHIFGRSLFCTLQSRPFHASLAHGHGSELCPGTKSCWTHSASRCTFASL